MLIRTSIRTCAKALHPRVAGRSLATATTEPSSPSSAHLTLGAAVLGAATGTVLVTRPTKKLQAPKASSTPPMRETAPLPADAAPESNDPPPLEKFGPENDFGAAPLAPDDPYGTLPEADEETHCSLCRTFRQGPCRQYWRRTEACWKEHDSERCLPYSQPFFHCTQYYQNLYHLIILSNYQEDYARLEEFPTRDDDFPATIDLEKWHSFQEDMGPSFAQTIPSATTGPLWQRILPETDPLLVPCDVRVPKTRPDGATLLQAFATDQDGHVLGVKEMRQNEGESPAVETASAEPTPVTGEHESSTTEAEEEDATEVEFLCTLLPGVTESVLLSAVYGNHHDDDASPVVVRKVVALTPVATEPIERNMVDQMED
jgi:hypothetical protein